MVTLISESLFLGGVELSPELDQELDPPVKRNAEQNRARNAEQIFLQWHSFTTGLHAKFWFYCLLIHSKNFIGRQQTEHSEQTEALARWLTLFMLSRSRAGTAGAFSISELALLSTNRGENLSIQETFKLLGAAYRDHVVIGISARNFETCINFQCWENEIHEDIERSYMLQAPMIHHEDYADKRRNFMALLQHSFKHSVHKYIEGAWGSRGQLRPKPRLRQQKDKNETSATEYNQHEYAWWYAYGLDDTPFMW